MFASLLLGNPFNAKKILFFGKEMVIWLEYFYLVPIGLAMQLCMVFYLY
jgi:hypothetical protein